MPLVGEQDLSDRDFRRISEAIYQHCGINLHEGKRELVRARLSKRLRLTGQSSFERYIDFALSDPDAPEFCELVDSLSTNLTSFFRENQHFEYLARTLLPRLMTHRGTPGQRIRGWSAGCSSGEEPYTIGIVLLETLGQAAASWDVKLLATDISTRVLRKATNGVYDPERLEQVPPAIRAKHFEPRKIHGETVYAVAPRVRSLVSFRHLNLMEDWPFNGPFDFIFCRNVMIYFDKPTQQKLVQRYHDVLSPGGVLFTGHSESLTGINHRFSFVQPTIYRKS